MTTLKQDLAEQDTLQPQFDRNGLIPCIATDATSGEVLMLGYMNELSLAKSIETGIAHYWSRSRQELWKKGETSGQIQNIREMRIDCDQDSIWIKVDVAGNGATCHVGYRSCFFRKINTESDPKSELKLIRTENTKVYDPEQVYGSE